MTKRLDLHSLRHLLRPITMIAGHTLKCDLPLQENSPEAGEWTVVADHPFEYLWQSARDSEASQRLTLLKDCHSSLRAILSVPIGTLGPSIDHWQKQNDELSSNSQKPNFRLWALCEGFSEPGFNILTTMLKKDQHYLDVAKQLLTWRKIELFDH